MSAESAWTGSALCSLASTISRSAIAGRHHARPRLTSISRPLCGGEMRSRDDPCSRDSPPRACHATPPALGISLAEIAGTTNASQQRPARAGPRDWQNACGNCAKPRHGPPARIKIEGRAETHFSPISVRRHREQKGQDHRRARQLVGSFAGQRAWADVSSRVPACSGRSSRSPASGQKIPNLFNAGKPQTPANGAYLFRPPASQSSAQSSDPDAEVGMFAIEGLAVTTASQILVDFGGSEAHICR